ncbi:phage minor tail U family protein [Glaesserella parasuis]|uniref:phage minor tail U family protein n=1 Tax=Glaesserella parasuis TaxID=738 RepID=UPI0021BD575B|nr:phage minor tail U family protein [Glaesserella parasuis]MCT8781156.1 phage minor tail U family protein [Glaesserella parasuis]MCT8821516.1 phage minor tail U family protein [Glaesserella parasuis]MDE3931065.1 phage minor tail U family protein [Glaesserella parasuis]MDE3934949.1 phage minor tail U family protein [Glaesserella parasuis]
MKIHNQIRKEVIDFLTEHLQEIYYFHNGLPKIIDTDNGLPLVAVYLNNASGEPVTIGHSEWTADLIILTYLPFYQGEEKLDEINEKINDAILFKDFENFSLTADFNQSYDYEYDTENNVWVSSALTFRIQYKFQQLNKSNSGDE